MRFLVCEKCAELVRAKDQLGLQERVEEIYSPSKAAGVHETEAKLMGILSSTLFWQEIFWLGNSLGHGSTVALAKTISPPYRVFFDLMNASVKRDDHPVLPNLVELYIFPTSGRIWFETIRSADRKKGYAAAAMRFFLASLDLHEVNVAAIIEVDDHDSTAAAKPIMTGAELAEWFGRLGFVRRVDLLSERECSATLDEHVRRANFEAALAALSGQSV